MTEADFFWRLEYRLSGEFAAVPPIEAPGLWCDGLVPERWQFGANPSTISGEAWVGGLPGHHPVRHLEKWEFILNLYEQATPRESIRWESLLPTDDARGWVVADAFGRRLVITLPANGSLSRTHPVQG